MTVEAGFHSASGEESPVAGSQKAVPGLDCGIIVWIATLDSTTTPARHRTPTLHFVKVLSICHN